MVRALSLGAWIVPSAFPETTPSLEVELNNQAAIEVVWATETGVLYNLEESPDMENWNSVYQSPIEGVGEPMRYEVISEGANRFFRLLEEEASRDQLLNLPLPEDKTRYDSYSEFDGPRWPESYGEGHVTLWGNGKFAAYSITIDDNNSPDFPFWLEVEEDYGWKFTWFVIVHPYVWDIYNDEPGSNTGYFGTLQEFADLATLGHDIQLHGACSAMNSLSAEDYEDHIVRSVEVLGNAVGSRILTFAYPCGKTVSADGTADYLEIIGKYMIGARGTPGGVTPVHLLNYLNTNSLGVNALVDGNPNNLFARYNDPRSFLYSQYRGWCVTLYHGLSDSAKVQARETFDFVKSHEEEFWVAPFTAVAKYAQERESATLSITLVETDRIEFSVSDRMDDTVFDHPLTIKLRLDQNWSGLEAEQDGQPVEANIVVHETIPYAMIKAIPDRGLVVLNRK